METGIYCIINKINGKVYIGYANSFTRRWFDGHRKKLKCNRHVNQHLQGAWNKYGEKSFKFERIEICEIEKLKEREHYWAKIYNAHNRSCGYNISPTGERGIIKQATESINKIKAARSKQIITEKHKENISKGLKGYKRSKEEIEKTLKTKAEIGYYFSPERRRKMSEAKRKYLSNPENRKKMDHRSIAVLQLDEKENIIKEWKSAKEASLFLPTTAHAIAKVCKKVKNYKTAGGFKWRYK
jgi:group I intron endonuclease